MQAAATLSFMGDMEQALKDLSLALPFHLIEVGGTPLPLPLRLLISTVVFTVLFALGVSRY